MADNVIQNTLASGELSPHLYGRTDLAKYHNGCMLAKNMFVDYRGGLSSRPGTQFIDLTPGNVPAHLQKFVFSGTQTYMLVFTDHALAFIRNPLTPGHINGSNAGYILAGGGGPYTIATPYAGSDLQLLKFSQSADVMVITHPSYQPMQLTRIADTNWTLAPVGIGSTIGTPFNLSLSITGLPTGSTDPQNTNYNYVVTAVGIDGQESQISNIGSITGINIASTQGTVTLNWDGSGVAYYNCYKAVPAPGGVLVPPGSAFGFIGTAYGTSFTDSNIIADFSQTPPQRRNPFVGGQVIGVNITASGSGYPVGATTATISDPNGATALIVPVLNNNTAGGTGSVTGFVITFPGVNITNGAAVVVTGAGGSGFAGTVLTSVTTGTAPAVSSYFQQRRVYAGSNNFPLTLNGSRVAYYNNFDVSNPPVDSDAYQFALSMQEINAIKWLISMPGGLIIFTDGGVIQLTGGSLGVSNPAAVTPSNAVIVPISFYGAADLRPIVINYNILYVQSEGGIIRDLAYNFFVNIYTGTDLTMLSSHFFAPHTLLDWAYQDVPYKIIWGVRDDGTLLSLTYLKEQDIYGWTHHDTQGVVQNLETVREGSADALYMVVLRNGNYCVERLAGNTFDSVTAAWCLDAALFTEGGPFGSVSGLDHLNGMTVYAFVDGTPQGPFTVSGGSITLTTPGSDILVGLQFIPQFQQLPIVPGGEITTQGKRHRDVVTTIRVADAGPGLQIGTSFVTLKPFRTGLSSTDTAWVTPYQPAGLVTGDIRMHLDAKFRTQGGVCLQMNDPLPFTILAIIDEVEGLRP